MAELNENVIEWFDGDDTIAVTLHQKRFVNRVRKRGDFTRKSGRQYICSLTTFLSEINSEKVDRTGRTREI